MDWSDESKRDLNCLLEPPTHVMLKARYPHISYIFTYICVYVEAPTHVLLKARYLHTSYIFTYICVYVYIFIYHTYLHTSVFMFI